MFVKYERRVVAFFEIIGWQEACLDPAQTERASLVAEELMRHAMGRTSRVDRNVDARRARRGTLLSDLTKLPRRTLTHQIAAFSDNVVLSMPVGAVTQLLDKTADLCRVLLRLGFLTRGGVSIGVAFHQGGIVFGPALIEAFDLAQTALLPRILCSADVAKSSKLCPGIGARRPVIVDPQGREVLNLLPFYGAYRQQSGSREIAALDAIVSKGLTSVENDLHSAETWNYMREALKLMFATSGLKRRK